MDTEMNTADYQSDLLNTLANEDQLDLQMSPVDKTTASTEIDACNDYLAINKMKINHQISEVPRSAITFLYNKALGIGTGTGNFVTGLKLNLAMENDAVVLMYQPVLMTRQPSALSEPFYNITAPEIYYAYDVSSKSFVAVSESTATAMISNYQGKIGIKHRGENTFNSFIPNVDTEAAIFPFQTIFALLDDNKANTVFFHNSIRKEDVGGSYSIKHCLLLSSQSLQINSFAGKFANRSHLCPPSCNSLQYALIR